MNLIEMIPKGEKNAIHTKELARKMFTNERAVIKAIHNERCKGNIICSGKSGYYMPENITDLKKWYKATKKRAISTFACLKSARKLLKDAGIDPDA